MIIKKYIVRDMKEAVIRAKYELGSEAVIISQSCVKVGKWYNPFKKGKLEVTVALEDNKVIENSDNEIEKIVEISPIHLLRDAIDKEPAFGNASEKIKEKLLSYCRLHGKKDHIFSTEEKVDFLHSVYKQNCFKQKLELGKINVMIGPTGVGKTTTIAKIAAKESLINKKKVGLITIDTYRIGAVEQVKTYANILGLPCEVVADPSEMEKKLNKLSYCDIVLIDTLGTSQRNKEKLGDIENYLHKIKDSVNIYLVTSISTDRETTLSILEKYKQLKYNALILTKFDEVNSYKNILSIIENNSYPVQYFCNGQDVPDDIQEATLDNLLAYCEESYPND